MWKGFSLFFTISTNSFCECQRNVTLSVAADTPVCHGFLQSRCGKTYTNMSLLLDTTCRLFLLQDPAFMYEKWRNIANITNNSLVSASNTRCFIKLA